MDAKLRAVTCSCVGAETGTSCCPHEAMGRSSHSAHVLQRHAHAVGQTGCCVKCLAACAAGGDTSALSKAERWKEEALQVMSVTGSDLL